MAEAIVALQVESANNTENAFEHISSFMTQLSAQMDWLTKDVDKMNHNRHETCLYLLLGIFWFTIAR